MANEYQGAVVREVLLSKGLLYLGLDVPKKGSVELESQIWFILDAYSSRPGFFITAHRPPSLKAEVKPLYLFLKARIKGAFFERAERLKNYGRRLILHFENSDGEPLEIEGQLFPQHKNLIARHLKSQISLIKPKEPQTVDEKDMGGEVRSVAQLYKEWSGELTGGNRTAPVQKNDETDLKKEREKRARALEKLKQGLKVMAEKPWREAGDWLKEHRDLSEVPEEFKFCVDKAQGLQENIERCYAQAKQVRSKMAGAEARILQMEEELRSLEEGQAPAKVQKKAPSLLENAKGRTKVFTDDISAYIGKSAADNLKLLRNAKAWHIWVHAKDMPGSHGIIALPKNKPIPDSILREVALWVLKESLSPKQWADWQGVKSQFIYTECRFVTPIKGDKLGRVRYKNDKTLTLTVR